MWERHNVRAPIHLNALTYILPRPSRGNWPCNIYGMVSPGSSFSFLARHPSKESSLRRASRNPRIGACVRACVGHIIPTQTRDLSPRKKKELLYPRTLTKSVVVDCNKRGKSGYGVAEEVKRKGWKGGREEWAEVAGQGTQSSGIKPSRLLPTSREFSPFSLSRLRLVSPSSRFVAVKRRPTMVCGVEPILSIPDAPWG